MIFLLISFLVYQDKSPDVRGELKVVVCGLRNLQVKEGKPRDIQIKMVIGLQKQKPKLIKACSSSHQLENNAIANPPLAFYIADTGEGGEDELLRIEVFATNSVMKRERLGILRVPVKELCQLCVLTNTDNDSGRQLGSKRNGKVEKQREKEQLDRWHNVGR